MGLGQGPIREGLPRGIGWVGVVTGGIAHAAESGFASLPAIGGVGALLRISFAFIYALLPPI